MTAGQFIDYESLAQDAMQEAMRGVVRAVLTKVAESGLSGDHHFYVAFHTQAPGVTISRRLKEKYPLEMTIVLQHRFWDLEVGDDKFSVKLTFDGIPERLVIPFKALKVFYDPSVPYGLQFEETDGIGGPRRHFVPDQDADHAEEPGMVDSERLTKPSRPSPAERSERRGDRPKRSSRADRAERTRSEDLPQPDKPAADAAADERDEGSKPVPLRPQRSQPALSEPKPDASATDETPADHGGGAKVVDLSAFRPKKK
jgi:uncharacterized protein